MKILLIVDDYLPKSIKIAGKMMHELAVELVSSGHEVSVITPGFKIDKSYQLDMMDGVKVYRFKCGEIKNLNRAKRAINETLLSFYALKHLKPILKKDKHDLVIYYSPTIFWGPLVGRLKLWWTCKSYLILRDIFPQWVIDNGILSANSPITKYFQFFERLSYKAADIIALQSPNNKHLFEKNNPINKPLNVLFNWSEMESKSQAKSNFRTQLGLENKIVFFYGGNIGQAQDMMNIVRLAQKLEDNGNAHFIVVGQGDEATLIKENCPTNMTVLPSVNQEIYEQMLSEFDIGLFSLHKNHSSHNFPGKLLAYMKAEKAILGSINAGNDVKDVIEKASAGFVSINGDDASFYKNAMALLDDENLRKLYGHNSKQLLNEVFSVKSAAQNILKSIKELA